MMMKSENERYRAMIDFLHENGLGNYVELPQIAVMGDTSAGKSSLLSQILGTSLACSSEITTLCPVRVRLEKGDITQPARVGITWSDSTREKWASKEIPRDQLHTLLREVQKEILTTIGKPVASDIIEVQLYDSNWDGLTLIDLPGIVRTVGANEDASIISDIRNLLDSFLRNERCVILAILPANIDFHNSQIIADAQVVDPKTKRTIPVITKPDLIDKGAEDGVLDLLLGKNHNFELGFHMVKCRGQKALNNGMSIAEGLANEVNFFQTISPWNKISQKTLFGVPALQNKLSKLQGNLIRDSIPKIKTEIVMLRHECQADIDKIGILLVSLSEKRLFFQDLINQVLRLCEQIVTGRDNVIDVNGYSWCARLQIMYSVFGNDILNSQLGKCGDLAIGETVTHISETTGQATKGVIKSLKYAHNESDLMVQVLPENNSPCDLLDEIETRDRFSVKSTVGWSTDKNYYLYSDGFQNIAYKLCNVSSKTLHADISWLKDLMIKSQTNDLSCFVNYKVFCKIISDFINSDWIPRCNKLIEEFRTAIQEVIRRCIIIFPEKYSTLRNVVEIEFTRTSEDLLANMRSRISDYLTAERTSPFTRNHYLFENIMKNRNRELQSSILGLLNGSQESAASMVTAVEALFTANKEKSIEQHVADEMLIILQGYGKVACKRCIDEVPKLCEKMLRDLVSQLPSGLIVNDEKVNYMFNESPETLNRLERLKEKLSSLQAADDAFLTMFTGGQL